jgi:hypothetical protein
MNRPVAVVVVALAFVLSGCVGAAAPGTAGQNWAGDPDNHWQQDVITVDFEAPDGDPRDYGPLLHRALVYWTEHSAAYAGYDVGFRRADPGEEADVHVRFVDVVEDCGSTAGNHTAGCAPVLTEPHHVDRPVDVAVRRGLSDESTVRVVTHELGHTLGLSHGEPPGVMDARMELSTLPQRNATERANPWGTGVVSVHVADAPDGVADPEGFQRQVETALDYYADGADGAVPPNVTFVRAADAENATVVVQPVATHSCRSGPGSCGVKTGDDPDGDGTDEYHDRLEVVLVDLDTDAVGWHVGRWLGVGYGLEGEEFPAPLRRSASRGDRRSDWWT